MSRIQVALALYTVRDHLAADFSGTLRKVAKMGYAGVEFAGAVGSPPEAGAVRECLDASGLLVAGNEVGLAVLQNDRDVFLDYQRTIGNRYIGVSSLPSHMRNPDGFREAAGFMNRLARELAAENMVLYYHNHGFEFEECDGVRGIDILYGETDPERVKLLPDLYWLTLAGIDPASFLREQAGRVHAVHLKDAKPTADGHVTTEVGEGIVDFGPVFVVCEEQSIGWYVVEQDLSTRSSLESARISLENLKKWGIG